MPKRVIRVGGRRRRRRGTSALAPSTQGRFYEEYVPFSIRAGNTIMLTVANLTGRPPSCNFRPLEYRVEAVGGFVPVDASDGRAGFWAPCSFVMEAFSPAGEIVVSSRPLLLGPQPRVTTLSPPPSTDWWPYNNTKTDALLTLTADCLGGVGGSAPNEIYARGFVFIKVALGLEIPNASCPKLLCSPPYSHSRCSTADTGTSEWDEVRSNAASPLPVAQ